MASEVTPLAVIKNTETGKKCPLADYLLTPSVTIIDPMFGVSLSKKARTDCGINVLVHVVDAYVPVITNEYTDGLAKSQRLGQVIQRGFVAREKMHNAATIDGMAVSSTFLGIIHSMAHKTGAAFRLPYGRCVAMLLKSETTAEGVEVLAKAKTSTHI
ncbi:hypothetical protein EIN_145230, partial [Entamoeba invadens IP1]